MKMLIAGAGPAGLYLAYLVKRQLPDWEVRIVEQNARDSTFGFGVVFSERALEFLRADDPGDLRPDHAGDGSLDRHHGRAPRHAGGHRRHRLLARSDG